jgi:hypothetical protein
VTVDLNEAKRELRVLDQSITAFSVLRDRYERRDTILTAVTLAGSSFVAGLAVAGDAFLQALGIQAPDTLRAWIAVVGIVLASAAFLAVRFDWAGKASLFGFAADTCSRLKGRYREAMEGHDRSEPGRLEDVRREYHITMAWLPRIPDAQFIALKAKHHQKVALSRLIDRRPFVPMWWVRLVLSFRQMRAFPSENEDRE